MHRYLASKETFQHISDMGEKREEEGGNRSDFMRTLIGRWRNRSHSVSTPPPSQWDSSSPPSGESTAAPRPDLENAIGNDKRNRQLLKNMFDKQILDPRYQDHCHVHLLHQMLMRCRLPDKHWSASMVIDTSSSALRHLHMTSPRSWRRRSRLTRRRKPSP